MFFIFVFFCISGCDETERTQNTELAAALRLDREMAAEFEAAWKHDGLLSKLGKVEIRQADLHPYFTVVKQGESWIDYEREVIVTDFHVPLVTMRVPCLEPEPPAIRLRTSLLAAQDVLMIWKDLVRRPSVASTGGGSCSERSGRSQPSSTSRSPQF